MAHTAIADVLTGKINVDSKITTKGWVKTRRDSNAGISFLQVHDGSTFDALQIVVPNTLANYTTDILRLTAGCAVSIEGIVVASPGKGQVFELQAESVEVIGWVENPETYPIAAKRHTLEFLREVAHLRPRTNTIGAVMRVRHVLAQAIHQFFDKQGFFWVHTPIITASDCEGAGQLFRVSSLDPNHLPKTSEGKVDFGQDFFGRETFLTVSGQLNLETYCMALSKVYTFGPTFRAENSNTSRHLAEFWMIEPEVAFADLTDIAHLAEDLLKTVCQTALERCSAEFQFFKKFVDNQCLARLETIIREPFVHMDYTEAVHILKSTKKSFTFPINWGIDLQSEHERYLAEEYVGKPVVLMNYPKEIKSFYMRQNDDGKTVACMDVLAPGIGEIIGGSQREERLTMLDARIDELALNKAAYAWYRDLRKFGSAPHSGFGLGFERLISYVTGVSNVRDVIPFPRTPGNATF